MSHSTEYGSRGLERGHGLGRIVSHLGISYHSIGVCAAIVDALAIFLASLLRDALYHAVWYDTVVAIDQLVGMGVATGLVWMLLATTWGLYRLPVLIAPRRHLASIAGAWACALLGVTLLLFLLKVGAVFSRGALL